MVGWHQQLGYEFEQAPGVGDGPGAWCAAVHVVLISLLVSSGCVLLSNVLPCPLPSCFTWRRREGIETISRAGLVQQGLL